MNTVVLLAGGSGFRMQKSVNDKSTALLLDKAVFMYGLEAFLKTGAFEKFIIVYRDASQKSYMQSCLNQLPKGSIDLNFVEGGLSRFESVRNALSFIRSNSLVNNNIIAIHDAVRPLIHPKLILKLLELASDKGSAIPVSKVTNTIMSVVGTNKNREKCAGIFKQCLDREKLRSVETPQLFKLELLSQCYFKSREENPNSMTDDASLLMQYGHTPFFIENEMPNPKITTKNDLDYILYLLNQNPL